MAETPDGPLRLIGVCIPWFASRLKSGTATNWEDHGRFLEALTPVLAEAAESPCIVAGDFNQRIPRSRQPETMARLLEDAFRPLSIATAGVQRDTDRKLIDHVAVSRHFQVQSISAWPGQIDGRHASDHDGVLVEVAAAMTAE